MERQAGCHYSITSTKCQTNADLGQIPSSSARLEPMIDHSWIAESAFGKAVSPSVKLNPSKLQTQFQDF
ncbi:hypothetical protein PsorP6_002007 [Peronosclerospora sorghi]|uniref:Uncharacterized protein n=1 Tax=Peronosclerospora sorghi TaxID=230839 RepID=A0ACC0WSZ0_9STRA|nr:hypothetical protein PsorP6_002007 [Peronosclerospora sorghi]